MSRLLTDFPMKKKRSDETRHIEGWQSKNERIESLLNVLYDFRFNTVKSRTEYRAAGSSDLYQPVTKFALNTFRRRLDATADIATSTDNIRMILESDFARKAHPIQEYFNALPLLNPAEHGHIGRLLNTVQVANPGKWEEYFTKWLIGVVANAMNDTGCQNHTCLVLTGDRQGQFKSWWLDNLCPTPLKNYLFTGKIDPQGKDILTLIAEYPSLFALKTSMIAAILGSGTKVSQPHAPVFKSFPQTGHSPLQSGLHNTFIGQLVVISLSIRLSIFSE